MSMQVHATHLALLSAGIVNLWVASLARAQSCEPDCPPLPQFRYTIIDLGTFGSPGSETYSNATGINELGHVAGVAEDDELTNHGFLFRDGQLIDIGALSQTSPWTVAKGVNDLDQVVGYSFADMGDYATGHPFLWAEGQGMIDLAPEWPGFGQAWGINNSSQVALTLNGPYWWDPVTGLDEITLPGCPDGCGDGDAWEINNQGLIVGNIRDPVTLFAHAFKYDSTTDTIVDLHDDTVLRQSFAYGLNDLGDVVGWAVKLTLQDVPLLWTTDGELIELPTGDIREDLLEGKAEHINNRGDIVGHDFSTIGGMVTEGWVLLNALDDGPMQKLALEWLLDPADLAEWELTWAFEINDARQITGFGLHNGLTRAYLLTPTGCVHDECEACPWDLDGNGVVEVPDFLDLLSQWGTDPGGPPDFDGDGSVAVPDFLELLANWGPCPV
jgi:probable HAF family extracellular repeat protein